MPERFFVNRKIDWLLEGAVFASVAVSLYAISSFNYPLFHILAEFFSITISASVFLIAWNTRRLLESHYTFFLGVAFVFVAMIDLLHTLSYKGISIFSSSSDIPTQLWIAARYLQAVSFLLAPIFIKRKLKFVPVFAAYSVVSLALVASILFWKIFPVCFIDGVGQTAFKVISEYVISAMLLVSAGTLYFKRRHFDGRLLFFLIMALCASIFSELAFSAYVNVFGFSNFLGHILKILAFYYLYRAIVVTGLARPYSALFSSLKESENNLREERDKMQKYLELAKVMFVVIDADRSVSLINKKGCEILGRETEEVVGKNWHEHFLPVDARESQGKIFDELISGRIQVFDYYESKILRKDGEERIILWRNTLMKDDQGAITAVLSAGEDITDYKVLERQNEQLNKIVNENADEDGEEY